MPSSHPGYVISGLTADIVSLWNNDTSSISCSAKIITAAGVSTIDSMPKTTPIMFRTTAINQAFLSRFHRYNASTRYTTAKQSRKTDTPAANEAKGKISDIIPWLVKIPSTPKRLVTPAMANIITFNTIPHGLFIFITNS